MLESCVFVFKRFLGYSFTDCIHARACFCAAVVLEHKYDRTTNVVPSRMS